MFVCGDTVRTRDPGSCLTWRSCGGAACGHSVCVTRSSRTAVSSCDPAVFTATVRHWEHSGKAQGYTLWLVLGGVLAMFIAVTLLTRLIGRPIVSILGRSRPPRW